MSRKFHSFQWVRLILECRDLPSTHKWVLVAIADHANEAGKAYPSKTRIAALAGVSYRSVGYSIQWLKKERFLSWDSTKGEENGTMSNRYVINIARVIEWLQTGPGSVSSLKAIGRILNEQMEPVQGLHVPVQEVPYPRAAVAHEQASEPTKKQEKTKTIDGNTLKVDSEEPGKLFSEAKSKYVKLPEFLGEPSRLIRFRTDSSCFIGIEEIRDNLMREFPRIDVDAEIAKAARWLGSLAITQPKEYVRRKDVEKFVRNWLGRASNSVDGQRAKRGGAELGLRGGSGTTRIHRPEFEEQLRRKLAGN